MVKHFCVEVYVVEPKNKSFLFIKHKKFNKWFPTGGHIEENESPDDAAVREVFEETGLQIELFGERFPRETDLIRPLTMQINVIEPNEHIHMDFVYVGLVKDENQALVFNEGETDGIGWFKYDEIMDANFDTSPDVKMLCKKVSEMMWSE